ncbi:hypothetical protein ACFL1Z_00380 [Thermodesulfobacteriota bacterium]
MTKKHITFLQWLDILAVILLFFIALTVRFTYQNESIIDVPIRKDAKEYFFAAYNLYHYNIYSTAPSAPSTNIKPDWDFKRPPGYPLFLYLFLATSSNGQQFLARTTAAQAIIGSLTVVVTFLLSRLILTLPWSFLAGLLTALSPHLVAVDQFILTESIFTFTLIVSITVFTVSWKKRTLILSILSGLLFGFLTLIRPISLFLGPFLSIIYFIRHKKENINHKKALIITQVSLLLAGYLAVYSPYLISRNILMKNEFSISDQSVWGKVVIGSDIGLKDFIKAKTDTQMISEKKRMTRDKLYGAKSLINNIIVNPVDYIKWYFGGKMIYMWKWDNTYVGDVYQYPMIKKGFQTNESLSLIHALMRMLHWPLYIIALFSPAVFLYKRYFRVLNPEENNIIPSLFLVMYFAILLSILVPLPRYAIPIRPFVYILAIYVVDNAIHRIYCLTRN